MVEGLVAILEAKPYSGRIGIPHERKVGRPNGRDVGRFFQV